MLDLLRKIIQVLRHFECAFSERFWEWAKVLVVEVILATGQRTVASALEFPIVTQLRGSYYVQRQP